MNRKATPRCVICVNVGKDANHYTKHNGVVVCPVIKNNVCRNCGKKGHFQDHCTKIGGVRSVTVILKRPASSTTTETPRFYFGEEDDEEDTKEEKPTPAVTIKLAPWAVGKVLQPRSKWAYMSDDEDD